MGADRDPANDAIAVHNEDCGPGNPIGIDAEKVIHAIGAGRSPGFVEQDREGILLFFDEPSSVQYAVDLLDCDRDDLHFALLEFLPVRLQLSQLRPAVGSPGSPEENDHRQGCLQIVPRHSLAVDSGKAEAGGRIAGLQSTGMIREHVH
jgi:hypothetical protein